MPFVHGVFVGAVAVGHALDLATQLRRVIGALLARAGQAVLIADLADGDAGLDDLAIVAMAVRHAIERLDHIAVIDGFDELAGVADRDAAIADEVVLELSVDRRTLTDPRLAAAAAHTRVFGHGTLGVGRA